MTTLEFGDFKSSELKKQFPDSVFLGIEYDEAIMGYSESSIIYHELHLIHLEMGIQSDKNMPADDSDEWQDLYDDCSNRINNTFSEFEGKEGKPLIFQQF